MRRRIGRCERREHDRERLLGRECGQRRQLVGFADARRSRSALAGEFLRGGNDRVVVQQNDIPETRYEFGDEAVAAAHAETRARGSVERDEAVAPPRAHGVDAQARQRVCERARRAAIGNDVCGLLERNDRRRAERVDCDERVAGAQTEAAARATAGRANALAA